MTSKVFPTYAEAQAEAAKREKNKSRFLADVRWAACWVADVGWQVKLRPPLPDNMEHNLRVMLKNNHVQKSRLEELWSNGHLIDVYLAREEGVGK